MIKLTYCLRRNPKLTREEFQRYWLQTHARLVAERADALGIRRYVQVHTLDLEGLHEAFRRRNERSPEPYDGVAELWFEDVSAITGTGDSRMKAAAELLADERHFIDLSNSPMWLSQEHQILPETPE
ncbi:MAG: EthD domain-containing protein [Acidimicrobiales bacterium]